MEWGCKCDPGLAEVVMWGPGNTSETGTQPEVACLEPGAGT